MASIELSMVIGEDRRIQLPDNVPIGPAKLVIEPQQPQQRESINQAREAARAKLLAAGFLVTNIHAPEGTVPLTVEERMRIGQLPPGARPSDELIIEDRGEY